MVLSVSVRFPGMWALDAPRQAEVDQIVLVEFLFDQLHKQPTNHAQREQRKALDDAVGGGELAIYHR